MDIAPVPEALAAQGAAPGPMTPAGAAGVGAMSDGEFLRHWLSQRSEHCPLCRYNLRGLSSDRCPECGRELRLAVHLVELSQFWWLTLFIPLAMVAGIGALFVVVMLKEGRVPNGGQGLIFAAMLSSIVGMPLAGMCLMFRRRFLRLRNGVQFFVGLLGPLYALVVFTLFGASIR